MENKHLFQLKVQANKLYSIVVYGLSVASKWIEKVVISIGTEVLMSLRFNIVNDVYQSLGIDSYFNMIQNWIESLPIPISFNPTTSLKMNFKNIGNIVGNIVISSFAKFGFSMRENISMSVSFGKSGTDALPSFSARRLVPLGALDSSTLGSMDDTTLGELEETV